MQNPLKPAGAGHASPSVRTPLIGIVALIFGLLFQMSAEAQTPVLSNGLSGEAFPGEQVCFDLSLSNNGTPGYGPYVRLILPQEMSLDSVTSFGSGVTVVDLGAFPAAPGNQITDPLTGSIISGSEGETLYLLRYPLGAAVQGGPDLVLQVCASLAPSVAVGQQLDVAAQAVYEFGDTATGDNGPITGSVQTSSLFATLMSWSSANDAPEGEAAPGQVVTHTSALDVADGKTVFDLVFSEYLPAGAQYIGPVSILGGVNAMVTMEPSLVTPGGALELTADNVTGTASSDDLVISYPVLITDVLDEGDGGTLLFSTNRLLDYEFPDDVPGPSLFEGDTVLVEHVVIRKGSSPQVTIPGDTLTYSLAFSTSAHGTVSSLVVDDLLPDGMSFGAHVGLVVDGTPYTIIPTVSGGGSSLSYDITAVTGNLPPGSDGQLIYTAAVDQLYSTTTDPVLASDQLTNTVTGTYSLVEGASGASDGSAATVEIEAVSCSQELLFPQQSYLPGDTATFRFTLNIPSGDTSAVVFEEFFALPVFDATSLNTTFGTDIVLAPTDTVGLMPDSISVNAATNSLQISWPDLSSSTAETLAVDVTITVEDAPFGDGLFLTNILQVLTQNTPGEASFCSSAAMFFIAEPELTVTAGVSTSDHLAADATISPSPSVLPIDGDIALSDAGDTLNLVTTVENIGGAPASDVVVTTPTVAQLSGASIVSVTDGNGSPLAYTGSIGGGITLSNPLAANDGSYGPPYATDTALVTVSYTLDSTIQPAEVVTATSSAVWASIPGGAAFPAVEDQVSISAASPVMQQTLTGINPGYSGNLTEASIGELLTHTAVITVPEGRSENVVFTELVDNGLAITDVVSITPSSGDLTTDTPGGFPGVRTAALITDLGAESYQRDRSLTLDFGSLTNSNTDDATAETLSIIYRVRVLNWSGNDRGNMRDGSSLYRWDNPNAGGQLSVTGDTPSITITEPELKVDPVFSPFVGKPGDSTMVTLNISHESGSDAEAFDVTLRSVLPAGVSFVSGFTTSGETPTQAPAVDSGIITAAWDSFPEGSTAQVSFALSIEAGLSVEEAIDLLAEIEWESLLEVDELGMADPPNNTLGVERTGDPADAGWSANTYLDSGSGSFFHDNDEDGLADGDDPDDDNDGIPDANELAAEDALGNPTGFAATDPNLLDSDMDGTSDGVELAIGSDPNLGSSNACNVSITVSTAADVSDNNYTAGNFSLREAVEVLISCATNSPPAVLLDESLDGQTITLLSDLDFSGKTLTLDATGLVNGLTILSTGGGLVDSGGGLTKAGTGTLILIGSNSYSGGTTIGEGTLKVASDAALGANGAPVTFAGGTLDYPDVSNGANRAYVTTATGDARFHVSSGAGNLLGATTITGPGGLIKTGAATLNLQASCDYEGATEVLSGTLDISGPDERLPDSSAVTLSTNTRIRMFGANRTETVGSLAGVGILQFGGSAQHLFVGVDNSSTTFSGRLIPQFGGNGMVTKVGTGMLTLTGNNTYGNGTTVSSGTLLANNTVGSATGSGPVQVASTAKLGGSGSIDGAITVASGGALAPGTSVGTLTAGGGVSLGGKFLCELDGDSADRLTVSGELDITAGILEVSVLSAGSNPPAFVIASYGTLSGGSFASVSGLPTGYSVDYAYNDGISSNHIALVRPLTTYEAWAQTSGLQFGVNDGFSNDPNGDGVPNIQHFGLDSDPLGSGGTKGKQRAALHDPGTGVDVFTLTVPLRSGMIFSGPGVSPTLNGDGIVYTIHGDTDLAAPHDLAVEEVTPALGVSLPALNAGYEYRTFRLTDTTSDQARGFLSIEIVGEP